MTSKLICLSSTTTIFSVLGSLGAIYSLPPSCTCYRGQFTVFITTYYMTKNPSRYPSNFFFFSQALINGSQTGRQEHALTFQKILHLLHETSYSVTRRSYESIQPSLLQKSKRSCQVESAGQTSDAYTPRQPSQPPHVRIARVPAFASPILLSLRCIWKPASVHHFVFWSFRSEALWFLFPIRASSLHLWS
jgi:hypothetical protein